ncbi:MAG: S24/S26 family peptidase [Myxococcota bacterium]|nr:S24/S26 family peptidase [Myxococcota bacterium]
MNSDALCDQYLELMCEQLARGQSVKMTARGHSMWPFIRDADTVKIVPISEPISCGDVVCVRRDHTIILHRVVAIDDRGRLLTWGDALPSADGWISMTAVYGIAHSLWRSGQPRTLVKGRRALVAARILGNGRRQLKRFSRTRLGIFRRFGQDRRHE